MKRRMKLIHGDCLVELKKLADNSVDSIVTDSPYGISFMGKKWDYDVPSVDIWKECLRVLKPGGHLLAFAGTRTQHRMAVRIEDAGFEIRDMIAWVYGSGFPKSLNIGKAVDKLQGNEREVVATVKGAGKNPQGYDKRPNNGEYKPEFEATKGHSEWEGWGTALKPALEPITVARKPLIGTVAENVLTHGTGGLNIDGCRVGTEKVGWNGLGDTPRNAYMEGWNPDGVQRENTGRFPANLIHDGSEEVVGLFPSPHGAGSHREQKDHSNKGLFGLGGGKTPRIGDSGSAARFFYCAKASKKDRDEGLEEFSERRGGAEQFDSRWKEGTGELRQPVVKNHHPTVKPTDLMRYLCRLVTPPGGIVLDPFMGSGSTGKAAKLEGFKFIGIEREEEYVEIARARITGVQPTLLAAE